MGFKSWMLLALFAVVLALAVAWFRRRRSKPSVPIRRRSPQWLMGLLLGLAAASFTGQMACTKKTSGDEGPTGSGDIDSRLAKIRTRLLAGLKASVFENDQRASGNKARGELAKLVYPLVETKQLSKVGAERLLDLHEECVAHTLRSMATCYEPMPVDWVDWETGGGARQIACKRLELLDEMADQGKLSPLAATKAKTEIASRLAYLDALKRYLASTDESTKAVLKKKILDGRAGEEPDPASLEAAAFVLRLFESS